MSWIDNLFRQVVERERPEVEPRERDARYDVSQQDFMVNGDFSYNPRPYEPDIRYDMTPQDFLSEGRFSYNLPSEERPSLDWRVPKPQERITRQFPGSRGELTIPEARPIDVGGLMPSEETQRAIAIRAGVIPGETQVERMNRAINPAARFAPEINPVELEGINPALNKFFSPAMRGLEMVGQGISAIPGVGEVAQKLPQTIPPIYGALRSLTPEGRATLEAEGASKDWMKAASEVYEKETPSWLKVGLAIGDPAYALLGGGLGLAKTKLLTARPLANVVGRLESAGMARESALLKQVVKSRGTNSTAALGDIKAFDDYIAPANWDIAKDRKLYSTYATARPETLPSKPFIPKSFDDVKTKLRSMDPRLLTPQSKVNEFVVQARNMADFLVDRAKRSATGGADIQEYFILMQTREGRAALASKVGNYVQSNAGVRFGEWSRSLDDVSLAELSRRYAGGIEDITPKTVGVAVPEQVASKIPMGRTSLHDSIENFARKIYPTPAMDLNQGYMSAVRNAIAIPFFGWTGQYPALNIFSNAQDMIWRGKGNPLDYFSTKQFYTKLGRKPEAAFKGIGAAEYEIGKAKGWRGALEKTQIGQRISQEAEIRFGETGFMQGYKQLRGQIAPRLFEDAAIKFGLSPDDAKTASQLGSKYLVGEKRALQNAVREHFGEPIVKGKAKPVLPTTDLRLINDDYATLIDEAYTKARNPQSAKLALDKISNQIKTELKKILSKESPEMREALDESAKASGILHPSGRLRPKEIATELGAETPYTAGVREYLPEELAKLQKEGHSYVEVLREAERKGIVTAGKATPGVRSPGQTTPVVNKNLLNALNKVIDEKGYAAIEKFNTINDVRARPKDAWDVLEQYQPSEKTRAQAPVHGETPQIRRGLIAEDTAADLLAEIEKLRKFVDESWGKGKPVSPQGKNIANFFNSQEFLNAQSTVDVLANKAGEVNRNWMFHDYGKRYNADTVAARFLPFHFWMTREGAAYFNWLVENPGVLNGYMVYKQEMDKLNQQLPETWRDQIQIPMGVPLVGGQLVNVENLVNPINRFGQFFGDIANPEAFGTPAEKAFQLFRVAPGIEGAIRRSGVLGKQMPQGLAEQTGRIGAQFPQTGAIKALSARAKEAVPSLPIPPGGVNVENIPLGAVNAMTGANLSAEYPYDPTRIGRIVEQMQMNGEITDAQAIEAMTAQRGEIWDKAKTAAYSQRVGSDVSGLLTGARFTTINPSEQMIAARKKEIEGLYAMQDQAKTPEDLELAKAMLKEFYQRNPTYSAYANRYDTPEERAKVAIRDAFYNKSALDQRELREKLGVDFARFMSGASVSGLTAEMAREGQQQAVARNLGKWAKALGVKTPEEIAPSEAQTIAGMPEQYTQAYDQYLGLAKEAGGFDKIAEANEKFFGLDDKGQRGFLEANPWYKKWLDDKSTWEFTNPQLATRLEHAVTAFDDPKVRKLLAERDALYTKNKTTKEAEEGYFSAPDKNAHLIENPGLKGLWRDKGNWYFEHPEIAQLLNVKVTELDNPEYTKPLAEREGLYDKFGKNSKQVESGYFDAFDRKLYLKENAWLPELWDEKTKWAKKYPKVDQLLKQVTTKELPTITPAAPTITPFPTQPNQPTRTPTRQPTPAKTPTPMFEDLWERYVPKTRTPTPRSQLPGNMITYQGRKYYIPKMPS